MEEEFKIGDLVKSRQGTIKIIGIVADMKEIKYFSLSSKEEKEDKEVGVKSLRLVDSKGSYSWYPEFACFKVETNEEL